MTTNAYDELLGRVKDANLLGATAALLSWDQEVMMPPGGLEFRSRQVAQIASMQHRLTTDTRIGELLAECEAAGTPEPTSPRAVNLREIRRGYDRATKLPPELVEEVAKVSSLARHEWAEARNAADFERFRPWLEKLVGLARRQAECYGWPDGGEAWDALAESYEPGCTATEVEEVFGPLRQRLQTLIAELATSAQRPSRSFLQLKVPIDRQERFVRHVAEQLGFDYRRGRLDTSAHPFTSGTHCNDVRMTTRFDEGAMLDALGSTMHETGHALYEQGLREEHIGTPMGSPVSLGIHESQSRLWENQVGRSRAFWAWLFPRLEDHLGADVRGYDLETVYGAANLVEPGFIRVDADEATYNMHVMVRFELERALLRGDLAVADLPAAWNERYQDYLGLEIPDDRRGCLQDIHWSMGAFGYFPTYTLGNLYAAQLFETAQSEIADLDAQLARGEFTPLRSWLNERIHAHGQRYRPRDLCRQVTGKPLSADPLLRHLEGKLKPLYGL